MRTIIYKSRADFINRDNIEENGVSEEFSRRYPDWYAQNKENKGCWDCWNSKNCLDCESCWNCENCWECKSSKDSEDLYGN